MSGYKPATTSSRYTPAPRYQHMASRSASRPAYQSRVGPPTTSRSLYSPARSRSPASGARLTATYIRPGTTSSSRSSAASGASTYAGAGGTSSGASSGAALRSNSYARLPSTSSRIGRTGSAEAVARLSRSSSSQSTSITISFQTTSPTRPTTQPSNFDPGHNSETGRGGGCFYVESI